MASHAALDAAKRRFLAAIDQIEAAVDRLGRAGSERRDLEDTLTLMQDDRERLAEHLDAAQGRTRQLEEAGEAVAARLDGARLALRRLLAEAVAEPPDADAAGPGRSGDTAGGGTAGGDTGGRDTAEEQGSDAERA